MAVQDADGNAATPAEQVTTSGYDAFGRIELVAAPEGTLHYQYDDLGRLWRTYTGLADPTPSAASGDGKAVTDTRYTYDTLGRLKTVNVVERNDVPISPEMTVYYYDAVGNLGAVSLPNGVLSDYDYDELNRLVSLVHTRTSDNAVLAGYDARDNAPSVGLPVYNTAGQLVAASSIYTGTLVNPVYYNGFGSPYGVETAAVWTGSDAIGVGVPGYTLGSGTGLSVVGFAGGTVGSWIDDQPPDHSSITWALYALSDPITVPIPEPSSIALAAIGVLTLGALRFFRHSLRSPASRERPCALDRRASACTRPHAFFRRTLPGATGGRIGVSRGLPAWFGTPGSAPPQ